MARGDRSDPRPGKRPLGITLFSLAMGWLSFAGLANAATTLLVKGSPFPGYFAIFALAYALAAGATAVGLWRRKAWTLIAFRLWMGTCGIFMATFAFLLGLAAVGAEVWPGLLAFLAFVLFIFWLLDRYIRARLPPARWPTVRKKP